MTLIAIAALATFALLAVWLALELPRHVRLFAAAKTLHLPVAVQLRLMPLIAGADGADEEDEETEGDAVRRKQLGDELDQKRTALLERITEMTGRKGEDKEEVQRREKELAEKVDELTSIIRANESAEVKEWRGEFEEKVKGLEDQLRKVGRLPEAGPRGTGSPMVKGERYTGGSENLFLDLKEAAIGRRADIAEEIREYAEKFQNPDRQKSWAIGGLEEKDFVLPDIQAALPFLHKATRVKNLFREIRTSSPAVEFPVYKTGLEVAHQEPGEAKKESTPEFDLIVARVYTIAGITDVPNQTLEDFPAARGFISTELGMATGAQEESDVLTGNGTGQPKGILENTEIPKRAILEIESATKARELIIEIFKATQDVRVNGLTEPTDIALNPAVWTDIAIGFESNIGFLYGPGGMEAPGTGLPSDVPQARVAGLPVTWSSYIPTNIKSKYTKKSGTEEAEKENTSPIIVGNFQDGIVLRRSPFTIDVDMSIGFKKNLTSFRGEERMGFLVIRPKSFVKITGFVP